jgi:hypothetical protein
LVDEVAVLLRDQRLELGLEVVEVGVDLAAGHRHDDVDAERAPAGLLLDVADGLGHLVGVPAEADAPEDAEPALAGDRGDDLGLVREPPDGHVHAELALQFGAHGVPPKGRGSAVHAEDQAAGRDAGAGGDQDVFDVGDLVDRGAADLADASAMPFMPWR